MRRLAIWLSTAGAIIWVVGVIAWMSGVWVTLPPDAVRPLVLTLFAVVGGLLLAVGAAVGRTAARSESRARMDA
jgi:hypothetical protein